MAVSDTRIALVTGGGRGIGSACCLALARDGWDIVVNCLRQTEAAESVAETVRASGGRALVHRADVSSPDEVSRMIASVQERFGPIHLLVNNAGIAYVKPTLEQSMEEWSSTLAVDLTGPFLCIKGVLPQMIKDRRGIIINVASVAGVTGGISGPAYAAAKGGLVNLTRYLARELLPHGVRVNCVLPPVTATEMALQLDPEEIKRRVDSTPLRRMAQPSEVAQTVAVLASDAASTLTGECVRVGAA